MDLIFVKLDTFIIQFIILVIIIWVLNKFLFKPYLKYLDEELEKQKKLEDDYNNIDAIIRQAEENASGIIDKAKKKSEVMINDAEKMSRQKSSSIIEKAEKEAENLRIWAEKDIEKEKMSMMDAMKTNITDLVLRLTSRILKDNKPNKDFIEKELDLISK